MQRNRAPWKISNNFVLPSWVPLTPFTRSNTSPRIVAAQRSCLDFCCGCTLPSVVCFCSRKECKKASFTVTQQKALSGDSNSSAKLRVVSCLGNPEEKDWEVFSFPFVSTACSAVVAAASKGRMHGRLKKGLPMDVGMGIFSWQAIFGYLIGPKRVTWAKAVKVKALIYLNLTLGDVVLYWIGKKLCFELGVDLQY